MSVIAKLQIHKVTPFGTGQSVDLGCVASNDMMAGFDEGKSAEDKLFSTASPSGEMRLNLVAGFTLGRAYHDLGPWPDTYYAMIIFGDEADDRPFELAAAVVEAKLYSVTEFGGTTIEVRFNDRQGKTERTRGIDRLNWRMSVDNPAAQAQFKAGTPCVIAFYDARPDFGRDDAIRDAHAGPAPEA